MQALRPMRRLTRGAVGLLVALFILTTIVATSRAPPSPASIVVPYSATPVQDVDLDGNPATGAWTDGVTADLPLENGETSSLGSVTLTAKHDGTDAYFRVQGKIDVRWQSSSGDHFWFGLVFGPSTVTGHHKSGQDGVFFGESVYTSSPPLLPVDTNGGGKPPAVDTSQDDLGEMKASGTSPPFDFTAEWKRKLDTGDSQDVKYVADGSTAFNFYATTDSDGGGSGGGAVSHNAVTNDNVMRFAVSQSTNGTTEAIGISHTPPNGIRPGNQIYLTAVLTNATAATIKWRNSTMTADETVPMTNLSTASGTGWAYAAYLPAQPTSTQVRYSINASNSQTSRSISYFLTVAEPVQSGVTAEQQVTWILTLVAIVTMVSCVVAVAYAFIGRRLRRERM
jgi:hypothetical protein